MTAPSKDRIAQWAQELAAIRTQADLAREDVRTTLAGLRAQLRRWAERETALLGLISGRAGEQLPLVGEAVAEAHDGPRWGGVALPDNEEGGEWHLFAGPGLGEAECGAAVESDPEMVDALPKHLAEDRTLALMEHICSDCLRLPAAAGWREALEVAQDEGGHLWHAKDQDRQWHWFGVKGKAWHAWPRHIGLIGHPLSLCGDLHHPGVGMSHEIVYPSSNPIDPEEVCATCLERPEGELMQRRLLEQRAEKAAAICAVPGCGEKARRGFCAEHGKSLSAAEKKAIKKRNERLATEAA